MKRVNIVYETTRPSIDVPFFEFSQQTKDERLKYSDCYTKTITDSDDGLVRTYIHDWTDSAKFYEHAQIHMTTDDYINEIQYNIEHNIKSKSTKTISEI